MEREIKLYPRCTRTMTIGNNFRRGGTFLTDSDNTRRRFRIRSRLSLYAEADPRCKNLCRSHLGPRGHRRGACANYDLPCGGPGPYRGPSCPSSAPYRCSGPCAPDGRHRALALSNRDQPERPRRPPGLAREIAPIAGDCALVAQGQSGVDGKAKIFPHLGQMRELGWWTIIIPWLP
jgi:hypothetical protein